MRRLIAGRTKHRDFVSLFDTSKTSAGSSGVNSVKLPLISGFPYIVDWGDGVTNTITSISDVNITHTYTASGIYEITILSPITGFVFNNTGDRLKLIEILSWGDFTSNAGSFYGCQNLKLENVKGTPKLIGVSSFFRGCTGLVNINNLSFWDLSAVTNMNTMFYGCPSFIGNGLENWNVANVTSMVNLFSLCASFNRPLNWNVTNVLSMAFMFEQNGFMQELGHFNFNKNVVLQQIFLGKNNYPPTYYDAFLIKVAAAVIGTGRTQTNKQINGLGKYTSAGASARAALISDGWTITDGGMI